MNLQEQINRIQSMMGLLKENEEKISPAPWGIIFDGKNKILVGDMHQIPVELSQEYEDEVVRVANEFGYWGEGIGLKHNKAITESNFYNRLDPKKEMGSWDLDGVIESKLTDKEKKHFLYALFSNIGENHRLERLMSVAKEGEKIIDVLNKTIPDWSADSGKLNMGSQDVEYFLKNSSDENGVNLLQMAKENDATEAVRMNPFLVDTELPVKTNDCEPRCKYRLAEAAIDWPVRANDPVDAVIVFVLLN